MASQEEEQADDDWLLASLGGQLMNSLLADLQEPETTSAGTGDAILSLEQLEQELAQLEGSNLPQQNALPTVPEQPPPSLSAASMVLQQNQPLASSSGQGSAPVVATPQDAWSSALLEQQLSAAQDFLQADSLRKQQQQGSAQQQWKAPAPMEAYNVTEQPVVSLATGASFPTATAAPPPGLMGLAQSSARADAGPAPSAKPPPPQHKEEDSAALVQEAAERLAAFQAQQQAQGNSAPPPPHHIPKPNFPRTPANSISIESPVTPQSTPQQQKNAVQPQQSGAQMPPPPRPPPQGYPQQPPVQVPVAVPVGVSMPPGGGGPAPPRPSAWQTPPPPPPRQQQMPMQVPPQQQPPRVMYCNNPLPQAPPVNVSQQFHSRYMTTRDICFVIHSFLRPLLQLDNGDQGNPFRYDVQFWSRHAGGMVPPSARGGDGRQRSDGGRGGGGRPQQSPDEVMASRSVKAKEWSEKHGTLGHSSKTNVRRPRALLAEPIHEEKEDDSTEDQERKQQQRQRAVLWRARIYVDQAYQAYMALVECWRSVPPRAPGAPALPASTARKIQPHLIKLLKCMGVTSTTETAAGSSETTHQYELEKNGGTALSLLLKLPKGRVLLARVLEQALIPLPAVQVMLPTTLKVLYDGTASMDTSTATAVPGGAVPTKNVLLQQDTSDHRLFAALARVIQNLSDGPVLLECLQIVETQVRRKGTDEKASPSLPLGTQPRVQCVHAILQCGSRAAEKDPAFAEEWAPIETEFMNILTTGGM